MEKVDNSQPSGGTKTGSIVKLQETSNSMKPQMKDIRIMKWTDEKHSLYLNSMEASFVHQLHSSLDLHGRASSRSKPIRQKLNPSGQFKLFQDGCWQKVEFGHSEPELKRADETGRFLSNPWIQHYTGSRQHLKACSVNVKDDFPSSNFHLSREDEVTINTRSSSQSLEGTDQNFTDEDAGAEEKSGTQSKKRMKKAAVSIPHHDQVVPFGKFLCTEDVDADEVSS